MKAVSLRELKTRLSKYLRLVEMGETVLIVDREEVIAELRPAPRQCAGGRSVEAQLQMLASAGEITRASLPN